MKAAHMQLERLRAATGLKGLELEEHRGRGRLVLRFQSGRVVPWSSIVTWPQLCRILADMTAGAKLGTDAELTEGERPHEDPS